MAKPLTIDLGYILNPSTPSPQGSPQGNPQGNPEGNPQGNSGGNNGWGDESQIQFLIVK